MGNTHFSGSLISFRGIYAAGTTNQSAAAATVIEPGYIRAAKAIIAIATVQGSVIKGTSGNVMVAGNAKRFAAGTIYSIFGATSPPVATGLTTVQGIFLTVNKSAYASATQAVYCPRPCVAAGTPGSFYPQFLRMNGLNAALGLAAAATGRYFIWGV